MTAVVLSADFNLPPYSLLHPIHFQLVLGLDRFVLTNETTVCSSGRFAQVTTRRLLPPNFTVVRLRFRCDVFAHKLHHHCHGDGTWEVEMKRTFGSDTETIRSLTVLKIYSGVDTVKGVSSLVCLRHPILQSCWQMRLRYLAFFQHVSHHHYLHTREYRSGES